MIDVIYRSNRLATILGEPSYDSEKLYKSSMFNFIVFLEDRCLVCNTLMRILVSVRGDAESFFRATTVDEFTLTQDVRTLIEFRVLVPTDVDEFKLYRELHSLMLAIENNKQGVERYNILTTTGCNARCFYDNRRR